MDDVLMTDIDRVSELSKQGHYDFIVVGSGLAGGVLARKLIENKKRILVIEKGGVVFTSHCLNTSRPHWQINSLQGPSQDNDIVYGTTKQKVETAAGSDPYAGGPVYCLGGRSAVWGLYSPRIIKKKHRKYFPQNIAEYLEKGGYERAFGLFTNGSQDYRHIYPTADVAQSEINSAKKDLHEAIEQFYTDGKDTVPKMKSVPHVDLSPMAAEFKSSKTYNFPQGAYSTVDYLLDRAYARDTHLTILLNTEVLTCPTDTGAELPSLLVRSSPSGDTYRLFCKKIILCAGTIGTATIALNSGLQNALPLVGKGLTDHEIWGVRFLKEKKPDEVLKDAMKFQWRMVIGERHEADSSDDGVDKNDHESRDVLVNVAINANTFLAREFCKPQHLGRQGEPLDAISPSPDKYDTVNITIETQADLSTENQVLNIPTPHPVVHIRHIVQNEKRYETMQIQMQDLATQIRNKLLKIEPSEPAPRLSKAGFGAVAHEVGTMRIKGPRSEKNYVVDENLKVEGVDHLYVCDLSIFPFSPPANPSLTLGAIALWLADHLSGHH